MEKEDLKGIEEEKEISKNEERIRSLALSYYSRKDVLTALFQFSQNREISPRYFEGFGKRPDSFQYPSDIFALVKKGATSFHCSEELWQDPLQLSTELTHEQLSNLRTGWDLIIDIDCKWIDYSKKAAEAVVRALEFRGVKNINIKFSGSKGFHIIIPWQAFPEEINNQKTKDMFPEWPKIITEYVKEISGPILESLMKDSMQDFAKQEGFTGVRCENCKNLASEAFQITLRCDKHKTPHIEIFKSTAEKYKQKKCPDCSSLMEETKKIKFHQCNHCNLNSIQNPNNFHEEIISTDVFKVLGLDLQLASSRHLFRMPYSLHEKTALASIVISKNKIRDFNIKDADPFNVKPITFIPEARKNEAKELLIQALDWHKSQNLNKPEKKLAYLNYSNNNDLSEDEKEKKFQNIKLELEDIKDENFPPAILKILKGMEDGRKRALFILLNFFKSLNMPMEEIAKKINSWNQLNKPQLKQGYINSQLIWHSKQKSILPPNFDNSIYKEIGVYEMDDLSLKVKNPVNYVIRKSGAWKTNINIKSKRKGTK
ncbi:hypothetical protein HYW74_00315 [Candidatus Pacearchaeota archaeon]|nr:hypothetical protein [Candidatus Pacearchaeota archaeon]